MSLVQRKPELEAKLAAILERKSNFKKELEPFIIPFSRSELPVDLRERFDFKSYALEIGSGWGEFTLASAQADESKLIVALEKKKKRVMRCAKLQKRSKIENIRWMVVDVDWFFEELFVGQVFDKIVINFPDPWPKLRHHKNRFLSAEFVTTLSELAKPNCRLEFATDFWPYLEEGLRNIESSTLWKNVNGRGVVVKEIAGRPKSFFESMKRAEDENVYFTAFDRI